MKAIKILFFAAAMAGGLFLVGCSALHKNYGTIVPNTDIMQAIERHEIDPALNYYISGSNTFPNAIMGLNKAYTLDSPLWKKLELKPEIFRDLVSNMQTKASELSKFQHGFAILDNRGQRIGIWYSLLEANAVIKMQDERTVIIYTPPLDLYKMHEGKEDDNIPPR